MEPTVTQALPAEEVDAAALSPEFLAARAARLSARERDRLASFSRFMQAGREARGHVQQPTPQTFGIPGYKQVGLLPTANREGGSHIGSRGMFVAPAGFGYLGALGASGQGILPVSEWPKADAAVKAAWDLAAKLERSVESRVVYIGLDKSHFRALVATFKNAIASWSATLEKLKHDPAFGAADPVRKVQDWVDFGVDFDRWAREIDSSASFSSIWGMIKDVGTATALDIGKGVQKTGDSLIDAGKLSLYLVKYAPVIALVGGGVLVYLWGKRLVDPVGATIRSYARPQQPVAGLTRRKRRRRRSRR